MITLATERRDKAEISVFADGMEKEVSKIGRQEDKEFQLCHSCNK